MSEEHTTSKRTRTRSFTEAVKEKYNDSDDNDEFDSILIPQNRLEAYSKLHTCLGQKFMTLDGLMIGHAGPEGGISELCPNVVELDLTGNNFNCWTEVFRVVAQLPNLSFLNLTSNPLGEKYDKNAIKEIVSGTSLPDIKRLILNSTFTPLSIVYELLTILPSQELHLSLSSYKNFLAAKQPFPTVNNLHIVGNGFIRKDCIREIGVTFPSLTSLILCENPIKELNICNVEDVFPVLKTLSLSRTKISDWEHIDTIAKFPVLEDIRLEGIPLLNNYTKEEGRQLTISRLPGVKKLNKSDILATERENAERKFIRYYMEREDRPPRYEELIAIHGVLQRLADVDFGGKLRQKACVTIIFDERKSRPLTISLRQTTGDLKKKLAKMAGRRSTRMRLIHRPAEESEDCREMAFNCRRLADYEIQDGDEIEVI